MKTVLSGWDCMIKAHLHPNNGAQRDSGKWGSINYALPIFFQAHHNSNQSIKGLSLWGQKTTGLQNDTD